MKKNSDLTLANIGKLIDKKLETGLAENNITLIKMMDEKLARNNVLIFGAIDSSAERLEGKINEVEAGLTKKIDDLGKEMNERFDTNDDTHQEILAAVDEMTDAKFVRHCKTYHNVVS